MCEVAYIGCVQSKRYLPESVKITGKEGRVTGGLEFTSDGLLPVGDYELTFDELRTSLLVRGPEDHPNWDSKWRLELVNRLELLVKELWSVGITEIFVDGSFVEDKDHPKDIDGYFECDEARLKSGDLHRELNLLNPYKIWTWSRYDRRPHRDSIKNELPMWHKYRVDLWPHVRGFTCGILDQFGNELEFPAAFRLSRREHKPKGIIKIGGRRDS